MSRTKLRADNLPEMTEATLPDIDGLSGTFRIAHGVAFFATTERIYVLGPITAVGLPVQLAAPRINVQTDEVEQWMRWEEAGIDLHEIVRRSGRNVMTMKEHLHRAKVRAKVEQLRNGTEPAAEVVS